MSAFGDKADMSQSCSYVCFSNRPAGVKRFQAIHGSDGNVARGLVLLYGLGTQAGPSWDSKTRWNDLLGGLAVGRSKRTYELTWEHGRRRDQIPWRRSTPNQTLRNRLPVFRNKSICRKLKLVSTLRCRRKLD